MKNTPSTQRRRKPRPADIPGAKYVRRVDPTTGEEYYAPLVNGYITSRVKLTEYRRLTPEQFAIVGWIIWRKYNGWELSELFPIVKAFWPVEKGQLPIVGATLATWWMVHLREKKAGKLWP